MVRRKSSKPRRRTTNKISLTGLAETAIIGSAMTKMFFNVNLASFVTGVTHGSASGSLNEDSIFYLMSRGLNYQEAKKLLINGFLLDVIEKITDPEIKNLIKNIMSLKQ